MLLQAHLCEQVSGVRYDNRLKRAFLVLIVLQVAHSIEEYVLKFYEVFTPARLLNDLLP
jgi:hypothetical protein